MIAVCPTPCDADCESVCHEDHVVNWKKDHDALTCPGVCNAPRYNGTPEQQHRCTLAAGHERHHLHIGTNFLEAWGIGPEPLLRT